MAKISVYTRDINPKNYPFGLATSVHFMVEKDRVETPLTEPPTAKVAGFLGLADYRLLHYQAIPVVPTVLIYILILLYLIYLLQRLYLCHVLFHIQDISIFLRINPLSWNLYDHRYDKSEKMHSIDLPDVSHVYTILLCT